MSNAPFAPCPSCQRHVRVDASQCPFCASDLSTARFEVVPDLGGLRLGRAALFAFATSVAAVGCNSAQHSNTNIVQPYGAPPDPTPPRDAGARPNDPGIVVAIYGAPAPPPDASAPEDVPDAPAPAPAPADASAPPDATRPGSHTGRVIHRALPSVRYGAPPVFEDMV